MAGRSTCWTFEDASLSELSEAFLENGAKETGPTWTPDGSLLLYTSNLTGEDQVYAIDPSSGAVAQLTDDPDGAGMASVSPTGEEFAYVALIGDTWQVYTAEFPKSELSAISPVTREASKRVSNDDSLRYVLPHWSPDGQSLAMTSIYADGSTAVVTVDRDGANEQPILGSESDELSFGWIKDGSGLFLGIATDDSSLELITAELPGDHRHEALELAIHRKGSLLVARPVRDCPGGLGRRWTVAHRCRRQRPSASHTRGGVARWVRVATCSNRPGILMVESSVRPNSAKVVV